MPGNRDHEDDEVRQDHKIKFKMSAVFALALLAVSGLSVALSEPRRRTELIEDGALRIDRMRPGFDSGNFTIIPREDPEHKERCDSVNQAVHHGLANHQTKETVSLLCSESMWLWISESSPIINESPRGMNGLPEETSSEVDVARLSDETPCKVDVTPGTDEGQIAELNALNSICKALAKTSDYVKGYSWGFSIGALSLLYSLYHGKKAFFGARPEEQPLLEEQGEAKNEEGELDHGEDNPYCDQEGVHSSSQRAWPMSS